MKKFSTRNGASEGTYAPFIVGEDEIVLTYITLENIQTGDMIEFLMDITWDKLMIWDLGELELKLRHGSPNGPVLFWTLEACFNKTRFQESHIIAGQEGMRHFYLTVRSYDKRARICGNYFIEGTVYSPA